MPRREVVARRQVSTKAVRQAYVAPTLAKRQRLADVTEGDVIVTSGVPVEK